MIDSTNVKESDDKSCPLRCDNGNISLNIIMCEIYLNLLNEWWKQVLADLLTHKLKFGWNRPKSLQPHADQISMLNTCVYALFGSNG